MTVNVQLEIDKTKEINARHRWKFQTQTLHIHSTNTSVIFPFIPEIREFNVSPCSYARSLLFEGIFTQLPQVTLIQFTEEKRQAALTGRYPVNTRRSL